MDSSGKILVVDDEEVICNTLRLYLESQGFAVETANSGHEAIARIKEHEFEVVILDILMPQMNGLDVMRWINDRDAPVEVIITTGAGSHEVAVEAMRLGAFELLRKPILDFDEKLLLAVRQAGEHYRLKATLREKKARAELLDRNLNELYQFGAKILRAADDGALLAAFAEAVKSFLGEAEFLLLRASDDQTFSAVGRPDLDCIKLADPLKTVTQASSEELPLTAPVSLFPILVRTDTVGALALHHPEQRDPAELLPVLSLLPAVACLFK